MPMRKLKEYLDSYGIKYTTVPHAPTFTSSQTAHALHIPGQFLAKAVIVKLDGKMAMAVIPACDHVDLDALEQLTGATLVELADEREFNDLFPDCEHGAMPPLGNIYGLPVFVADDLTAIEQIVFNAGTHTELVQMAYADFERLANPIVARISLPLAGAASE